MQSEFKKITHPTREGQEVTDRLSALGTHDLFNLGTFSCRISGSFLPCILLNGWENSSMSFIYFQISAYT